MKIATQHLKRYKELVRLMWKHGRSDLVRGIDGNDEFGAGTNGHNGGRQAQPEELANDLEAMGPTYVKLAQILSGRSDLLPEPYLKALARLQDDVQPFPFGEVEKIIETELGVKISKAFSAFDEKPIAAASLGQVHLAALRDGRAVVVKVQRPDIRRQIAADFEVLSQIAGFLDKHTDIGRRHRFLTILDEFKATIQRELDYEREAQNMVTIGGNLKDFKLIQIPQPVTGYCTKRVLTMDYIAGRKITELGPLARLEVNGTELAEELFKAYLKQVLVDGIFHADPHPGNVFVTEDGRVALLDLGMVGHTTPGMQENLLKLLLALSEHSSEQAADLVIRMSQTARHFDSAEFRRRLRQLMAAQQDQGLKKLNVGRSLLEVSHNACDNGLFVPGELTLLGKTLLQLDEVGRILDADFDPSASIQRNVSGLMARRMRTSVTQGSIFGSLLETKRFMRYLPSRLNKIMDSVANAEFEVKIKALDTDTVVDGIRKVANRITAGLVLAALIVGAALLMRVQTEFRLFGYPGFAMICFLAATAGGVWLLLSIFAQDRRDSRKGG